VVGVPAFAFAPTCSGPRPCWRFHRRHASPLSAPPLYHNHAVTITRGADGNCNHIREDYGDSLRHISQQLRLLRGVSLHFAALGRACGVPKRRPSIAIHSGLPSGRPIVGARSIRVVVAASVGMARSAAKSGISARNGATVASSSSSRELRPSARPWPVLGTAHQPRDHRIESDVTDRRQRLRLVHHHRPKATLEQMARPPEASVDGSGVAPVRFGKRRPQPVRVRRRHAKWASLAGGRGWASGNRPRLLCRRAASPRRPDADRGDSRRPRKTSARADCRAG
jgi:hypothetical protein